MRPSRAPCVRSSVVEHAHAQHLFSFFFFCLFRPRRASLPRACIQPSLSYVKRTPQPRASSFPLNCPSASSVQCPLPPPSRCSVFCTLSLDIESHHPVMYQYPRDSSSLSHAVHPLQTQTQTQTQQQGRSRRVAIIRGDALITCTPNSCLAGKEAGEGGFTYRWLDGERHLPRV